MIRRIGILILIGFAITAFAWAPLASAKDFALLVGGLGAEEPYKTEFARTLASVRTQITETQQYAAANVRFLADPAGGDYKIDAPPTLENIRKEFDRLATESNTSDTLLLIVLAHGQSDFVEPKINLPGPDLTGKELRALLDAAPPRDQRAILIFPCSGHFSQILSESDRAILASCDGAREIYHSVEAPFLLQAFQGYLADSNRDGRTTLYELFEFLSRETGNFFESNKIMAIEHPSLDDNGDRNVSILADGKTSRGDGERAKMIQILPAPGASASGVKTAKPRSVEKADPSRSGKNPNDSER
jgi:hypothetical protein